jgi:hypothetical protein
MVRKWAVCPNAGFFVVYAAPGEREISTDVWDDLGRYVIKVNVEAGKTYYILGSPRTEHLKWILPAGLLLGVAGGLVASAIEGKSPFKLEPIDPVRAERLLLNLKLAE